MPDRNRQEPPAPDARRIPDGRRGAPEEAMRRRGVALMSTAFFSAAAHGFLFTNEFFSHDSVSYFAYADWGFGFYTGIGRFFIPLYEACKGGAAAPWLIGFLFVCWMSLAGIVVTDLLEIRSPAGVALSCGLLCTNVSLTLTGATYVYCMDEYALALLCAAAAAYLALRGGRLAPLGLLPLLVALSIYQPYATVTAALCLLALIKQASEGRRLSAILSRGAAALASLAAAFLAYNALWGLLRILLDVPQSRDVATLSAFGIRERLLSANASFFGFLFRPGVALGPLRPAAHGLLLILLLWRLLLTLTNRRLSAGHRVLSLALWALLPLALYSVAVVMPGEAHDLTAYARELFYFLPLSLLDGSPSRTPRRAERAIACALLALLLWHHVVYANQAYMKKELEKNSTLLLAARIVDRIEGVPGYVPGETRVAFAGRLDYNEPLDAERNAFEGYRTQTGLWHSHAATYNLGRYLTDYLQYPLVWDKETNVTRTELAKAMPIFPAEGSVRMIEGVVVVKLSD